MIECECCGELRSYPEEVRKVDDIWLCRKVVNYRCPYHGPIANWRVWRGPLFDKSFCNARLSFSYRTNCSKVLEEIK